MTQSHDATPRRYDRRGMLLLHDMFRRELGLAPALVRGVAPADAERAQVVGTHIQIIAGTLSNHHRGEDAFTWPSLLKHGPPAVAEQVSLVEGQHHVVEQLIERTGAAVSAWLPAAGEHARDELAEVLDDLLAATRDHMRTEEEQVVPLMERYLLQDEADNEVRQATKDIDPAPLVLGFGFLMYEGDPDVVEHEIQNMPQAAHEPIRQHGREAYAAHALQVYRTATPPRSTEI